MIYIYKIATHSLGALVNAKLKKKKFQINFLKIIIIKKKKKKRKKKQTGAGKLPGADTTGLICGRFFLLLFLI